MQCSPYTWECYKSHSDLSALKKDINYSVNPASLHLYYREMLRRCFQKPNVDQYKQETWNFSSKEMLILLRRVFTLVAKSRKVFEKNLNDYGLKSIIHILWTFFSPRRGSKSKSTLQSFINKYSHMIQSFTYFEILYQDFTNILTRVSLHMMH